MRWELGGGCQETAHVSLVGFDKESEFIFLSIERGYRIKGFK